jgi:hypothetical protein
VAEEGSSKIGKTREFTAVLLWLETAAQIGADVDVFRSAPNIGVLLGTNLTGKSEKLWVDSEVT